MLSRVWQKILLRPQDLASTRDDFEVIGVFNPGVVATPTGVVMLVRVAERPREHRPGVLGLPRWRGGQLVVDWLAEQQFDWVDPRVVRNKQDGLLRLTFASHLRVVTSAELLAALVEID